jgi:hypothetical protein
MPKLHLKFTLSRHQGFPEPALVASADLNHNREEDGDEAFLLTRDRDKLLWQGELSFDQPKNVDGLVVALVYAANPGVEMNVEVRLGGPDGKIYNKTSRIVNAIPEMRFLFLKEPPQ